MSALGYVGLAYAVVFVLIFAFAWRVTRQTGELTKRIDELERRGGD